MLGHWASQGTSHRNKYNAHLSSGLPMTITNLNNHNYQHRRFSNQFSRNGTANADKHSNESSLGAVLPLGLLATPHAAVLSGVNFNGDHPPRIATLDASVWTASAGAGANGGYTPGRRRSSLPGTSLANTGSGPDSRPVSVGHKKAYHGGGRGSTRHAISIVEARQALRLNGFPR